MKLLGLNSPEIFILLVILISILGTKRLEKSFILFKKLLKFLLSSEENEVKEEPIEAEVKLEEPKESEVKEEPIEAEVKLEEPLKKKVKSIKPKKSEVKDEIIDIEVNSDN